MAGLINIDNDGEQTLPTVKVHAKATPRGYWAGLTAAELKAEYLRVYALKTLSSAQYIVQLEPFNVDGPLVDLDLFGDKLQHALPWLATSTNLSVIDAQTDSVQVGHFQQNYITGNNLAEIQVTFLETGSGHILKAAKAIKDIMFAEDGTQGLPADYMMWLSVGIFKRNNRRLMAFNQKVLVALQAGSIDLASNNPEALTVPLSFVRMYPMLQP